MGVIQNITHNVVEAQCCDVDKIGQFLSENSEHWDHCEMFNREGLHQLQNKFAMFCN